MTRKWIPALTGTFLAAGAAWSAGEDGRATPDEVVAMVRAASALLAEQGEAGLETIRGANSAFVWKDSYVFVVNCEADQVLANPAFPEHEGGDIRQHTDVSGYQYGQELCEVAERPDGGWVEYVWPRPGDDEPQRKVSYVISVDGLPYQVGAGLYDDTISVGELAAMTTMPI